MYSTSGHPHNTETPHSTKLPLCVAMLIFIAIKEIKCVKNKKIDFENL